VSLLASALRYGAAGLLNTAIGFAVIAALDLGLAVNPFLANAAGYAVGLAIGFVLSRGFVFRHNGALAPAGVRYLAGFAACFALNQAVLALAHALLPDTPLVHLAAQLAGMAAYTASFFLICRYWVFRATSP
jgi:putative flippase GtrA